MTFRSLWIGAIFALIMTPFTAPDAAAAEKGGVKIHWLAVCGTKHQAISVAYDLEMNRPTQFVYSQRASRGFLSVVPAGCKVATYAYTEVETVETIFGDDTKYRIVKILIGATKEDKWKAVKQHYRYVVIHEPIYKV